MVGMDALVVALEKLVQLSDQIVECLRVVFCADLLANFFHSGAFFGRHGMGVYDGNIRTTVR